MKHYTQLTYRERTKIDILKGLNRPCGTEGQESKKCSCVNYIESLADKTRLMHFCREKDGKLEIIK